MSDGTAGLKLMARNDEPGQELTRATKREQDVTLAKINSNSVSLAGEFAVLSQLALRGYDANMTLGRTKSVDILVSNPVNGQMYQLEVIAYQLGGRRLIWHSSI